jgi:hypothetical protein
MTPDVLEAVIVETDEQHWKFGYFCALENGTDSGVSYSHLDHEPKDMNPKNINLEPINVNQCRRTHCGGDCWCEMRRVTCCIKHCKRSTRVCATTPGNSVD